MSYVFGLFKKKKTHKTFTNIHLHDDSYDQLEVREDLYV